jgi:hypothetical protein
MKRFWIVKKAPEVRGNKRAVTGDTNNCYTLKEAHDLAKKYASQNRAAFCVLELVACYEPVSDIHEVVIEGE